VIVRTLGGALLVWAFATPSHLTAQAGYPSLFTDGKGHRVTLTSKPARIASVVLGADENLRWFMSWRKVHFWLSLLVVVQVVLWILDVTSD
jgi:hypothetical protein